MNTNNVLSAVVSLSLAAAAGIHIAVMPEHLRASTVFGAFFAVVGAVQLAQAALILLRPTPLTSLITAAFNTAVLGTWALSRTTGLPIGPGAGTAETATMADIAAVIVEVVVVAGALVLAQAPIRSARHPAPAMAALTLFSVLGATSVVVAPARAHGHGPDHHASYAAASGTHDVPKDGFAGSSDASHGHDITTPREDDHGPARPAGTTNVGVEVARVAQPSGITSGYGALWVTSRNEAELIRIDLDGGPERATSISAQPSDVAAAFDRIWVTSYGDDVVDVIDASSLKTIERIAVGVGPSSLTVTDDAVWVTSTTDGTIQPIDPKTLTAGAPIATGYGPSAATSFGRTLWVANTLDRTATGIDTATSAAAAGIPVAAGAVDIATGFGSIWVPGASSGVVSRLDPATRRVVADVRTDDVTSPGQGPVAIARHGDAMWVANNHDRTLVKIDPATNRIVSTLFFSSTTGSFPTPMKLISAGGALYVTDFDGGSVVKVSL